MIYAIQSLSLKTRFLGVLLLLFPVLVFHWLLESAPWALVQLIGLSGGVGLPDSHWWYTLSALRDWLSAWGPEGRTLYVTVLWPTALGFLVSYAAFLTAAMLYLLKKANPRGPWWYLLPLLPLATAVFDLFENSTVALTALWGVGEPWAWLAPVFTSCKWVGAVCTGVVLAVGGVVTLTRAVLARNRSRGYTE
jgi:hypothetical protein